LNWLESAGSGIELAEVAVQNAGEPDAVGDLFDADQLAGEHRAEINLAPLVANPAAVRDQGGSVMKRMLEIVQF